MDSFDKFYNDLKKNRKECPWASGRNLKESVSELKNEIDEVEQALEKGDIENLKEELGDVFWDALFLLIIAEEKYDTSAEEIIRSADAKLVRRKPWVFGDVRIKDKDDAVRLWNEIKAQEKKDRQEYVYNVDESDKEIGKVLRSESVGKVMWHRGTGIMVRNSKGEILVHKRARSKDRFPSHYDMFFGGNVTYGESYEENAERELAEETGIVAKPRFLFKDFFANEKTKVHACVYEVTSDGPFRFQKEEIEEAFFVSPEKLSQMIRKEKFTPDGLKAYEIYLKRKESNINSGKDSGKESGMISGKENGTHKMSGDKKSANQI